MAKYIGIAKTVISAPETFSFKKKCYTRYPDLPGFIPKTQEYLYSIEFHNGRKLSEQPIRYCPYLKRFEQDYYENGWYTQEVHMKLK